MSRETADSQEWMVGTATEVITPESDEHHLVGFAARDGPMDGVEEDIHAKVVAIEDLNGRRLVLVSYEALVVPPSLRSWLEEECLDRWDLPPEAIVTNPTHTHYAPSVRTRESDLDAESPEHERLAAHFRSALEETLLRIVGDALDDLKPVELTYSHARCGFAMNRRDLQADQVHFGPYPDGPVDHDLPVLVAESDGTVDAILFTYACHTTSGATFNRVYGDYAGYAMQYLEAEYPGATAVFTIGCGADQKAYPQGELDLTKHYGRAVTNAVRAAIDARSRRPISGPLRQLREEIRLEREEPSEDGEPASTNYQQYPVHAVGFGDDLTMLSLAGEVCAEYSLTLKERFDAPLWISAYSQTAGYLPTAKILAEGGYEARQSGGPGRYVPSTEARIVETASALAERAGATRR